MSNGEAEPASLTAWEIGEPYKVTVIGIDGKEEVVTLNPVAQMVTAVWFKIPTAK